MKVRIYAPERSVMQSRRRRGRWRLEHIESQRQPTDPLTGNQGEQDTLRQVDLWFGSCDLAIDYAVREGYEYEVVPAQTEPVVVKSYAANFAADRSSPWTH